MCLSKIFVLVKMWMCDIRYNLIVLLFLPFGDGELRA